MQRLFTLTFLFLCSFFFCLISPLTASPELLLKNNLKRATPGDFIVTSQNKTYTLLHIYEKPSASNLIIEEITVPERKISLKEISWGDWVEHGAPGHTSWVIYEVDLITGQMKDYFSFSKNSWYDIPEADNFLSTLVNLRFQKIEEADRKRVGVRAGAIAHDRRAFWQPQMIVHGEQIPNVNFDAWRTVWPKDGSELSGKEIEVYLPQEDDKYPSYFPYWLQISGIIGKAKVRIVDSGSNLSSPQPSLSILKGKLPS